MLRKQVAGGEGVLVWGEARRDAEPVWEGTSVLSSAQLEQLSFMLEGTVKGFLGLCFRSTPGQQDAG